jgi:transcriptional regulator with XRE-family HTH domain
MKTLLQEWTDESQENDRLLAEEELILEATEEIWEALTSDEISKAELAGRLGVSKSHVTQLLNGARNMTLRTLADIAFALKRKVQVKMRPQGWSRNWDPIIEVPTATLPARFVAPVVYTDEISANDEWHQIAEVG